MTGEEPLPPSPILMVDDSPFKIALYSKLIANQPAEIFEASTGEAALAACEQREFALLILDVDMPGMDGFELGRRLAANPATRATPMIYVTSTHVYKTFQVQGYDAGAVDYLSDPVNPVVFKAKVQVFLDLYRGKQLLKREIVERKRQAELAYHQATHDPLTGLPNRLLFMDRFGSAIERSKRRSSPCALLYIDIDGFKAVNDGLGHQAGDALLVQIAKRLEGLRRAEDTASRLGGDEFALLMEQTQDAASAGRMGARVVEAIAAPYTLTLASGPVPARVGASIGAALYPANGETVDQVIHAADEAMYRAKKGGKNRCVIAGQD